MKTIETHLEAIAWLKNDIMELEKKRDTIMHGHYNESDVSIHDIEYNLEMDKQILDLLLHNLNNY